MKQAILLPILTGIFLVGCKDGSSHDTKRRVPPPPQESRSDARPGDPLDAMAEELAKPFAKMVQGFAESNPGLMEQIYKQRNVTPLHQAAWNNETAKARELIAAGADVNAKDIDGCTPLHSAALALGADVIDVLLAAGADINARNKEGATPLHVAMLVAGGGGDKAIPYLLKGKANINAVDNDGQTPLLYAFRSSPPSVEKAKQLIAAGADVNLCPKNGVGPLHWACSGNEKLVEALIAAGANVNAATDKGKTPLHYAAEFGRSEVAKVLLKAKADPNLRAKKGWSPMGVAADEQDFETVAVLRAAGAKEPSWTKLHEAAIGDESLKIAELVKDKSQVNAADVYGRTPLYWALRCNDEKSADLLIEAGAELTKVDKQGKTVLHVAAWAGRPDIVEKAAAAGADVNAADDEGNTALHWAAGAKNNDIVQFLLEKHAKVNAATKSGETPLLLAFRCDKPELVKRLLDAGADVLAVNSEGKCLKEELWKVHSEEVKAMLEKSIANATEKQIDAICHLYSPENPASLKADAIQPTTPNLAAVKMYRALFGPDKKAFAAMFIGREHEIAVSNELYDATQNYIAFRRELVKAYGADACQKFNALKIDGATFTLSLLFLDEGRFERMEVEVQGDRAVCHRFPDLQQCGDVYFVKQGDGWRINAAFLSPAIQQEANLRLFRGFSRTLEKGRSLLSQPGKSMEDVKRAMWEQFKQP